MPAVDDSSAVCQMKGFSMRMSGVETGSTMSDLLLENKVQDQLVPRCVLPAFAGPMRGGNPDDYSYLAIPPLRLLDKGTKKLAYKTQSAR
jgi:hypothetical protein